MANELLKTIDFGDGIKRAVAPEWENIQNKPENLATKEFIAENYYTKAEAEALIAQAITAAIAASY